MLSRPLSDFGIDVKMRDGHRSTCKKCRSSRVKQLKLIGYGIRPIEELRAIAYLHGVLRRAHSKAEYTIPVKVNGSAEPLLELGCVILMVEGRKMMVIRTLDGPLEYPFGLLNPERIVDLLRIIDMSVVVPGEADA